MTYERGPQPYDGAMLPPAATPWCFATVTRPRSNAIRYLCGDGEDCGPPSTQAHTPTATATAAAISSTAPIMARAPLSTAPKNPISADPQPPRAPRLAAPAG